MMRESQWIGTEPGDRYFLPIQYLDLVTDEHRLLLHFEYLSRINTVKSLLDFSKISWILDAGCGVGRFLYEIKDEAVNRVGIDQSERALTFARLFNPTAVFVKGDVMNFKDPQRFDAIVMIEVLEHFTPLAAQITLENLFNHLAPGGKLVVTVPSINKAVPEYHHRHFDEETLREILEPHFTITDCFGYTKSEGWRTRLWWKCRRICTWLYPFRHHIGGVTRLLERLNEHYAAHYAVGQLGECNGIVAVCERGR